MAFIASGEGHLFDSGQDLTFSYRCDITFPPDRPEEFYARWVRPGRKLEIRLQEPGADHTRSCRISTRPPIQSSQP